MFPSHDRGLENIKKTFAEDPVGFISDASIILTGGGTLATKVGPLTKIGEQAKKIDDLFNLLPPGIPQGSQKINRDGVTLYQDGDTFYAIQNDEVVIVDIDG